jgi:non-specific serine/threonine protein kinase
MPFEETTAEELPHADAVRLFVERAAAIQPHFALDSTSSPRVVEICRRLDGMPLAIEMAAARLRVLSPTEIAASLNDRFAFLKRPERDVTPRHETLEAAIGWSYDLLQPHLQTVFRNLAVFPGSFDLAAATAVALSDPDVEPLEAVSNLVESSMIARVADTNTTSCFRLLETLREYGTTRLREHGDLDTLRSAHADYVLKLVESADPAIGEPAFAEWIDRLDQHYDDIQQALAWSLEHHPRETLRMAPVLQHYWYRTGDARQARRWGLRMVDHAEKVPDELAGAAHAAVSFGGTILGTDPHEAIEHADRAVELQRNSSDGRGLATALFGRANAALMVGDFDTMRTTSREALRVCDEIGFLWGRAGSLGVMSFAHFFGGGSLDEAKSLAQEAVKLYRRVGDVASQIVINPVSAIALQQGDLATAERYAGEAAAIASGSGWEATALTLLAEVMIAKGALDSAEAMLQRAITRALDTGLENWFRVALRDLAQVTTLRGNHEKATLLIGASRHNMPNWGLNPLIYEGVENAGRAALGHEAFDETSQRGLGLDLDDLLDLALPD